MLAAKIPLTRQTTTVKVRWDLNFTYQITRRLDKAGFYRYHITNPHRHETLVVRRHIFDRLRAELKQYLAAESFDSHSIRYKGAEQFTIARSAAHPVLLELVDHSGDSPTNGRLTIPCAALKTFVGLLFDDRLGHPSDLLARLVAYHKLFRMTFVEGSESMTSSLMLKRNVLCETVQYIPYLKPVPVDQLMDPAALSDGTGAPTSGKAEAGDGPANFKSRLAEKIEGPYIADLGALFSSRAAAAHEPVSDRAVKPDGAGTTFPWPLLAAQVRNLERLPFTVELTPQEIKSFRNEFSDASGTNQQYFLGFEMIDAIHRTSSGLKSFRFPLYTMEVTVRENGRRLSIEPKHEPRIYLNHTALAQLVDTFGVHKEGRDPVEEFFTSLLAQSIEVDGRLQRPYLSRLLPLGLEVFDRTLEILLGYPGENGKGGLLFDLNLLAIEADRDSTELYRLASTDTPLLRALDTDLDGILTSAQKSPSRFYKSLLGRFLNQDLNRPSVAHGGEGGGRHGYWVSGAMPRSTRTLLSALEKNQFVLLQGPPGTGKTHTICDLLIHGIVTGQRMLVVSDQEAAITAIAEKLTDYAWRGASDPRVRAARKELLFSAIKIVPDANVTDSLADLARKLKEALALGVLTDRVETYPGSPESLGASSGRGRAEQKRYLEALGLKLGTHYAHPRWQISSRPGHPTTVEEIRALVSLMQLLSDAGEGARNLETRRPFAGLIHSFLTGREALARSHLSGLYDEFALPEAPRAPDLARYVSMHRLVVALAKHPPRSVDRLEAMLRTGSDVSARLVDFFRKVFWQHLTPTERSSTRRSYRYLKSIVHHPFANYCGFLKRILEDQLELLPLCAKLPAGVWPQLRLIHDGFDPKRRSPRPTVIETARWLTRAWDQATPASARAALSVNPQQVFSHLGELQAARNDEVHDRFMARLARISSAALSPGEKPGQRPMATQAEALLDILGTHESLDSAIGVLEDLRSSLSEAYPVWVCRKQAVPLLFKLAPREFDIVVVDEATQCRVDDALPLIYRAKKLMVVGDDRQTVREKDSVIDDYLYREFNLEEYLRSSGAHGLKGGGSNLFNLVASAREAAVLLDEHYRCPPDIISYSNRYVYNSQLKVMQWQAAGAAAAVEVDFSEAGVSDSGPDDSGKYRAIETRMVDRFLVYVEKRILALESELGRKIDIEHEVALVYFLLKNQPYFEAVLGAFLARMERGATVLSGAGASLQGKERNFIFYFWDTTRGNMGAFAQGDEPDKRRGELNVLMSRPKKRAFHFLHRDFASLPHHKATITDYLWRLHTAAVKAKERKAAAAVDWQKRTTPSGPDFHPWSRASGQLVMTLVNEALRHHRAENLLDPWQVQFSVTVGQPHQVIDCVLTPKDPSSKACAIALIDLVGFSASANAATDALDYFFQVARAMPALDPVFFFIHELAEFDSSVVRTIIRKLSAPT